MLHFIALSRRFPVLLGIPVSILGSVAVGATTGSILKALVALVTQLAAVAYGAVVLWNPLVAQLIGDSNGGPSSAARVCAFDQANTDWKLLAEQGSGSCVSAGEYYESYHSHPIALLARVRAGLKAQGCGSFVYLAGDSSLDNKHWFFKAMVRKSAQLHNTSFTADALNGYEEVLKPARMVQDVSYWLNREALEREGRLSRCTLMTAVEESTVDDRVAGLLAQDAFIRDHITERDALILSLGGNDIALRPRLRTAVNMLMLTNSPRWLISSGLAPGFGFFVKFFHGRIQELLRRMVAKRPPRTILVCMIYYLDPRPGGSWADRTLGAMGYDREPERLQLIIRTLFDRINRIGFNIPGVASVLPVPLFRVLDGSDSADYVQRVEPSVQGGRKMAVALLDALQSAER